LIEIPCWLLQYGGDPLTVARKIADHFERSCWTNRTAMERERVVR
jgi:hypothetical protein